MARKICFFTTCFAPHKQMRVFYAEKYLLKDVEIFLFTPKEYNKYELSRTTIIEGSKNKFKFLNQLRKLCVKEKFDILFNLGTPQESFAMVFATIFTKTKFIINIVSNPWSTPLVQKNFKKKLISFIQNLFLPITFIFAKQIVIGAEDICFKTKKKLFLVKSKIKHMHLIMDEKVFSKKEKLVMRKKLNLPLKKDILLFVGRNEYLKGIDILYSLIEGNPSKLFVLIGVNETKIKDSTNAIFLDSMGVKKLAEYYNAADLFVFPSRLEGYGLVSRESMLCETPTLHSDIESLRTIKVALKAKPNVKDFQEQIDLFFSMSKKQRENLGKKGRESIIKENSFDALKNKKRKLFLDD